MRRGAHVAVCVLAAAVFLVMDGAGAVQPSAVDTIRALYNKTVSSELQEHRITMNTMFPAAGLRTTTVLFRYHAEQVDPGKDPYDLRFRLAMVTVEYNVAASMHFHIEYLYDGTGTPIFYYHKEEGASSTEETRYYLKGMSPIRIIIDEGIGEKSSRKQKETGFSREELRYCTTIHDKAVQYRSIFDGLVKLDALDKGHAR